MSTFYDLEQESGRGCGIYDAADQLRDYVYTRTESCMRDGQKRIQRDAPHSRRREYIRRALLEALGGLPEDGLEEKAGAPQVRIRSAGVTGTDSLVIEKILYASAPDVWVSANLYIPKEAYGKAGHLPGILLLCGHDPAGKEAAEYQRASQIIAGHGMAVLTIDAYGQGERSGYYDALTGKERIGRCTREHDYAGFQCMTIGDSVGRYMLWDAMRGLDVLEQRPEVDAGRLGVTGNSGGGTLTVMMMMTDDRVQAAAPGTFITDRKDFLYAGTAQDNEQIWRDFTCLGIGHMEAVSSMAPRPVLLLAAAHDFFPISGTRRTFADCRAYWEKQGAPERIRMFTDDTMHTYSEGMAQAAGRFFREFLLPDTDRDTKEKQREEKEQTDREPEKEYAILPPSMLRCTGSGYVMEDERGTIFDRNRRRVKELEKRMTPSPDRMRSFLQTAVLHGQTDQRDTKGGVPDACIRRIASRRAVLGLDVDSYIWRNDDGLLNHAYVFFHPGQVKGAPVICLWDGGTKRLCDHAEWIRTYCRSGRPVIVADLCGMGMMEQRAFKAWPDPDGLYGAKFKLACDLQWISDSLAALRCRELLSLARLAGELFHPEDMGGNLTGETKKPDIHAVGRYSLYALVDSFLYPDVFGTVREEGERFSYRDLVNDRYYDPCDLSAFLIPGLLTAGDTTDLRRWIKDRENVIKEKAQNGGYIDETCSQ